jgi:hypothetical protein
MCSIIAVAPTCNPEGWDIHYDMTYLLTAIGWHPVAVVQYTFTHKQYIEQHN